ncbi:MAG: DUF748 domain-containing protein [Vibrio sp.]
MLNIIKSTYSKFKQLPLFIRITSYLLSLYALFTLILGLLIPAVAQSQLPDQLSKLLGRQVAVEKVSINPFLLRLQVNGFVIKEADQKRNFVSFENLDVQIAFWRSVMKLTPNVDHFHLTKPIVNVERLDTDSNFNFADIIKTIAAQSTNTEEPPATPEEATKLPAFNVRDIKLVNGEFDFIDRPSGAHLKYQGLNIRLPQLDSQAEAVADAKAAHQEKRATITAKTQTTAQQNTDLETAAAAQTDNKQGKAVTPASNENHFAINVTGQDKGSVHLQGKFQLEPFAIQGKLKMENITLANFWPFAEKQLDAKLTKGKFNFTTNFNANDENSGFDFGTNKGQFELTNLAFTDGKVEKLTLPKLKIDDIRVSAKKQAVNINAITLDGLWIDSSLDKQGLDLQKLFTPKATGKAAKVQTSNAKTEGATTKTATPAPATTESSDSSWLVQLNQFSLLNTDINLNEKMVSDGTHWRIYPLNIKTGKVTSQLASPIDYNVDLELNSWVKSPLDHARGKFASQGSIDPKNLTFKGKVNLADLDLSQFQTYLNPYINMKIKSGKLSTAGTFNADTKGNANYSGSVDVASLNILDSFKNQPLVQWENLNINDLNFDSASNALKIKAVTVTKPYNKIIIDANHNTNIDNLVKSSSSSSSSDKSSKSSKSSNSSNSKPFTVNVNRVDIKNGSSYFADESLTPSFASSINSLNGSITNLSSTPGTKATIDINGKINKYAPVILKGSVNPLIPKPYLDLDLSFKSVELTSINPYSGTYAGYYIEKGQLSIDLNYQLENNNLIGKNHVVIDQLKLGEKTDSEDAPNLPLGLAIAVLQDRHGVIDLGLDVEGDVSDPGFSIGGIVWQAFTNVLTKAAMSPLSLLSSLTGDDQQLDQILFVEGTDTLDDEEINKLDTIAKALDDKPALRLSIVGAVNAPVDSRALADQKLKAMLLEDSGEDTLPEGLSATNFPLDDDFADSLEDIYEDVTKLDSDDDQDRVEEQMKQANNGQDPDEDELTKAWHTSMYNQLLDKLIPSEKALGLLAEDRAGVVKAYLADTKGIAPSRLFILDSKTKLIMDVQGVNLALDAE